SLDRPAKPSLTNALSRQFVQQCWYGTASDMLHTEEVTGSIPVPPTPSTRSSRPLLAGVFRFFGSTPVWPTAAIGHRSRQGWRRTRPETAPVAPHHPAPPWLSPVILMAVGDPERSRMRPTRTPVARIRTRSGPVTTVEAKTG